MPLPRRNFDQVAAVARQDARQMFDAMRAYRDRGPVAEATASLDAALPVPPARVLEVGPGNGEDADRLAAAGFEVVGVDLRPDLVEPRGWGLVTGSAQDLPFGDGTFDVVRANRVIHHLPDVTAFWAEAARVVRPDGLVLCSWPDRELLRASDEAAGTLARGVLTTPGLNTRNPTTLDQVCAQALDAGLDPFRAELHTAWVAGREALNYALPHAPALTATLSAVDQPVLARFVAQLRQDRGAVRLTVVSLVLRRAG